jgi:hypothetical protein
MQMILDDFSEQEVAEIQVNTQFFVLTPWSSFGEKETKESPFPALS